ncbi:MAG: KEOPS complex subunit Cgi121 [Halovenus sp.]
MEVTEGIASIDDVDAFLGQLDRIATAHDTTVQAFDARYIVDREHLARAVELATRAAERERMIARELRVEILLYAAGRRQINRAVELGVSEGECPVVAVAVGGDECGATRDIEGVLEPAPVLESFDTGRVRSFFDIGDAELSAVEGTIADLVHERVAMLVVNG